MANATVFNRDPAAQARRFAEAGFEWLHVVDLDGALAGYPVNATAVAAIRAAVPLKIQLGGGIRDPALVRAAAAAYPERIAVAIDVRDGHVAIEGWSQTSPIPAVALARRFADCGVAAIIHTDIGRDGALAGVDAEAVARFAREIPIPVIASGGVAALADIAALKARERDGIVGVILGRALYTGRIDPRAALALAAGEPSC